jgi:hypothetical protein
MGQLLSPREKKKRRDKQREERIWRVIQRLVATPSTY